MAALARLELERLLQERRLGPTVWTAPSETVVISTAPTDCERLDEELDGGWPRGQVSEIVAPLSAGASWLACQSLAAATRRGELGAWLDPLDQFDPESAASAQFVWSSLLWVRGDARAVEQAGHVSSREQQRFWGCLLERSIKALALILQAEGFGVVVLDWLAVPPLFIKQLPWTTWRRVQRLVEGRETACLVLQSEALARSAGGVTLLLKSASPGARWEGRRFVGLTGQARVIRAAWQSTTQQGFELGGEEARAGNAERLAI
ncbi:MAG: hypothetical protein AB7I50_11150 [Vicinamibacterales bacterium]